MKKFLIVFVCLWLWLLVPSNANSDTVETEVNSPATTEQMQPVATYYLAVTEGIRKEVKITPPATKIAVISQSGDTTIRCGDGQNAYSCSPGKRLELEYEASTPLTKFWGENMSNTQVRLQIDVYQTVVTESKAEETDILFNLESKG